MCISNKFLGDAADAGPDTYFGLNISAWKANWPFWAEIWQILSWCSYLLFERKRLIAEMHGEKMLDLIFGHLATGWPPSSNNDSSDFPSHPQLKVFIIWRDSTYFSF